MHSGNHLLAHLRKSSTGSEERPFLIDPASGTTTTYGTFFARAEKMAAALVTLGVKPGDRVAVQAPKTQAMVELYVGTILAGAVFLPLNTGYTAAEVSYFLEDATPSVLVCSPTRLTEMQEIGEKSSVAHVLTIAPDESGSLPALRDEHPAGMRPVARAASDLAAILYTSGTTGRSKGAMLSHGALASNAETLADYWRFSQSDVLIHALPIFHTHGLFVALNVTLTAGSSCIFMPAFDADAVLDHMATATVLMGVPTFYTRLLEMEGLKDAARDIRLFVSGSAPLLAETHDRWRDVTGHAILERYGMTETNMNTSNPYEGDRRAGTVGLPLPGVEVIVTDPKSGEPLPDGEIGALEVRGPNVFSGYWQMPEKTKAELRDNGFFITGDLGKIDEDGYVHIVGRDKDLIISGGYNIYPKEIELLIDDVAGVEESAVIGVPHPDFGETVVAVVVRADQTLTEDAVSTAIKGDLARFKHPRAIVFVDSLPRNTMGKVQKKALRESYAGLFS